MTDFTPPDSFAGLTPELVLDAVDSSGLRSDGRMLALNSYENRVYQIGIEDASPIIAKFYRPLRWSDEAIQEEHDFVAELQTHEIPVIAALRADNGNSLRHYQGFRFSLFKRQSGRAPETGDPATLEWLGRFIGRIHAVGATTSYAVRPALNPQSFGVLPRAWLLEHDFIPTDLLAAYASVSQQALDGIQACYDRAGGCSNYACMVIAIWEMSCGWNLVQRLARTLSILMTAAWGLVYRTCGCCYRVTVAKCKAS